MLALAGFFGFEPDGVGPSGNSLKQLASGIHPELDADVQQFRYSELDRDLNTLPSGSERDLFTGILDNRQGRIEESIRLIENTLPITRTATPQRMAIALESLADDYLKSFRYRDASRTYQELLAAYAGQLKPGELQDVKDDAGTIKLLTGAPPQTIHWDGPLDIPMHKSPLGTFDVNLTVNGVTGSWILDTGANFSVLSASFAKRLGVVASVGTAQTKGSSGAENALHTGLIPEVRIGGATIHNVIVLIFDDKNLLIRTGPKDTYQIHAVIGYPVFQALGKVTFTRAGQFLAGSNAAIGSAFSRMFMNKLTPLLQCGIHDDERLFAFDTGASGSEFFRPYYREFAQDFAGLKLRKTQTSGAGGAKEQPVYILKSAKLMVSGYSVVLYDVPVFPKPLENGVDLTYGNLGRDLVAGFDSFTLDFTRLRFYLGKQVAASETVH